MLMASLFPSRTARFLALSIIVAGVIVVIRFVQHANAELSWAATATVA